MLLILYYAIYKKGGHFYRKNVVNLLIYVTGVSKLMILLGINTAQLMRFIKIWQLSRDHYRPKYILILAGDHIYKQDYSQMLLDHVSSNAKCTVGCIEVPREQASEFGVMAVDERNLKVNIC